MLGTYFSLSDFHERKFKVIHAGATWIDNLTLQEARNIVSILKSRAVAA